MNKNPYKELELTKGTKGAKEIFWKLRKYNTYSIQGIYQTQTRSIQRKIFLNFIVEESYLCFSSYPEMLHTVFLVQHLQ